MFNLRLKTILIALGIVAILAACTSTPTLDPEGKRTDEGLVKVKGSQTKRAWADPDVDFSSFSSIYVSALDVSDITIRQPSSSYNRGDRWELTEDNQAFLQSVYAEKMSFYLFETNDYTQVAAPTAGTLVVNIAVTHIAPNAAKEGSEPIGMSRTVTQGAGSMSIAGEFKDGATGKVVARFEDTRDTDNEVWGRTSSVRSQGEVRGMFDYGHICLNTD